MAMNTEVILSAPLFKSINRDEAMRLLENTRRFSLPKDAVIFREGENGDRLYVIESGRVKLGRRARDGRENLLSIQGSGEILGEIPVFDPGPRTATATAMSPVTLVELSHDALFAWLHEHPRSAIQLLGALAARMRKNNETLSDLVFSDVMGRVAKALLDLTDRFGEVTPKGVRVPHGLTQEELAQLVGASRETVNKALMDFTNRGWIKREGRTIFVYDQERLRKRAK